MLSINECIKILKDCPFCGSKAYIWNISNKYRVSCKNDCVSMPARPDVWFTSKDVAAEMWNTRADTEESVDTN